MGWTVRRLSGAVAVLIAICALASCGPQNLSALGNPGDYCTEDSSCGDGTSCRPVEDGFRCMGSEEADRAARSRRSSPPEAPEPVGSDPGEDLGPSRVPPIDVEDSGGDDGQSMEFDGQSPDDEEPPAENYVPPSRRRPGGR
jgi:hypothetical protein